MGIGLSPEVALQVRLKASQLGGQGGGGTRL